MVGNFTPKTKNHIKGGTMAKKSTIEQLLERQRKQVLKSSKEGGWDITDAKYEKVTDIDFEIAASYTQDAIIALLTGKEGCNPDNLPTWYDCYQPYVQVMFQGEKQWEQWPETGHYYIYTGCVWPRGADKLQFVAYYFYYNELGMHYKKEVEIEQPW